MRRINSSVLLLCLSVFYVVNVSIKAQTTDGSDGSESCPVIKTNLGEIAGIQQKTVLGNKTFCSYRGIRYAKAPIGPLRFTPPVESGPWNGIYNASEFGAPCIQSHGYGGSSEDCLFLNVFTPNTAQCGINLNNIPVIVFIHGGGFLMGSAYDDTYGPHLILNECVIFVTLHYRLGAFGFLSLALDEYSGNMALKDQKLALAWVNKHISSFGGNPKQVTLMGLSVGSTSTCFQRLNEKSRMFFKQAYAISGASLNYFALSGNNNKTDLIVKLANEQNITIKNTDQLIHYIQTVDAMFLSLRTDKFKDYDKEVKDKDLLHDFPWQPCVESKTAIDPFITEHPQVILSKGVDIPTIYTYTPMETALFLVPLIANPSQIGYLNNNFTFSMLTRGLDEKSCKEEIVPILNDIRRFYFGNDTINESHIVTIVQLSSYINFLYGIHKEIVVQAQSKSKAEIRLLRVNQRTALNFNHNSNSPGVPKLDGASHGDDMCSYLWCGIRKNIYEEISTQETLFHKSTLKSSEILREILISFATTGIPVSKTASFNHFPPVHSDPFNNLPFTELLSVSTLASGANPEYDEFKFWWNIEQRLEEIKKLPCNKN